MPGIEIVDMKGERDPNGKVPPLSRRLVEQIARTLETKKQSLLFLNRRGFNTYHYCGDCAHVFRCLNCAVSLTHHLSEGLLRCHYCDFAVKAPPVCPECGGTRVLSYGLGTERLAAEVQGLFPQARIARMDSDTTSARGSHGRILAALDRGEIDILVGTQMIAKGHDFPDVTLVGVVSADTTLNMPDFRAAERTFQLLTQVSGRSGRGGKPGTVVIQTLNPGHYAIRRTREHDFAGFYADALLANGQSRRVGNGQGTGGEGGGEAGAEGEKTRRRRRHQDAADRHRPHGGAPGQGEGAVPLAGPREGQAGQAAPRLCAAAHRGNRDSGLRDPRRRGSREFYVITAGLRHMAKGQGQGQNSPVFLS